ncbi:MAG: type IV pilus secretin PilQ [Terriglobales bacterium]
MRLKQLLGVSFLLLILGTMAAAAGSQLTNVSVSGQGNATTIILHASGSFTHTEYRPVDNLLLVDLAGVQPGKFKDTTQTVNQPGLASYHVVAYAGSSGAEVTRVELSLNAGAVVHVSGVAGGLQVRVESGAAAAETPAKPVAAAMKTTAAPRPAALRDSTPAQLRHVSVVRGRHGMEIEIAGTGQMKPSLMKLTGPDRLVLDLVNTVPVGRQRPIVVNGNDIKSVRVGRFQLDPPVTRVVVDLAAPRDYEIVPSHNKLVLKLRAGQAPVVAAAPVKPAQPTPQQLAATEPVKPAVMPAPQAPAELAVVAPQPESKPVVANPQPKTVAEAAAKTLLATEHSSEGNLLPPPSASLGGPAVNMAAQQAQAQQRASQAPAAAGQRYTGEPISVNLKDVDLKDFFRLIHEISGLNIVVDPNVHGTLTLVLDDVPWDQALDIVLQNNGLDRRLEGNVLRIATRETFTKEAESRRAQADAQALAVDKIQVTHFLSYAHANETLPIVKKFLSQRGDVVADPRTNALIITDIPSTIPEIQRLLGQLDRKTQEVEIEARVVAATRNFARDIGVQLGFAWGNRPTAVGGAGAVGTSPLQVAVPTPTYFTTGNAIPLFSNLGAVGPTSGISVSNATSAYRVDAILTMAESKGLLKILSRPRVVTQNNIGATVKQGVKIPVVTAAQLGGPPTTTYVDAELRLQVTPQITVENTIFLNVDVENTTPDFGHAVQGNPTLITQQATTAVLVTDGGTVVIGGVIQTSNSVSISQVPLLGDIPIFGNLFKHRSVSTQTQELIFFITPKIVQT